MSYVIYQGYFSNSETVDAFFTYFPDISEDELISIVGIFEPNHHLYPNKLKGEYLIKETKDGTDHIIRHHFTKKVLFKEEFKDFNKESL